MTHADALDVLAARCDADAATLRRHCRDDNPRVVSRDHYRRLVIALASAPARPTRPKPGAPPTVAIGPIDRTKLPRVERTADGTIRITPCCGGGVTS